MYDELDIEEDGEDEGTSFLFLPAGHSDIDFM
jgi:hypothetical protein